MFVYKKENFENLVLATNAIKSIFPDYSCKILHTITFFKVYRIKKAVLIKMQLLYN